MTSYPVGIFLIAALALGQDGGTARPGTPIAPATPATPAAPDTKQPAESAIVHKLDTVVWNPGARELSWVVSVWDLNGTLDEPLAKQAYTVRLDNATMKSNGETRTFDTEEARQVRLVMDMISAYAVGSTVWWERGEGGKEECPIPDKNKGAQPESAPAPAPTSRPAPVALPGPIAAAIPVPQAATTRR